MDFSLKLEFLLQSFKFLEFSFLTCRKFNLSCFSQPQNLLQAICHCLFVYCLLTLLLWIFICSDLAFQVAAASKCFSLHSFTKHHVVVPSSSLFSLLIDSPGMSWSTFPSSSRLTVDWISCSCTKPSQGMTLGWPLVDYRQWCYLEFHSMAFWVCSYLLGHSGCLWFLAVSFSAIWTFFAQNLITELDLNFD